MGRAAQIRDDGQADGTTRRCLVTRAVQPTSALVRFVVSPEGALVPDVANKLPGRGHWVSADRALLDRAVRRRLFDKAAKHRLAVPEDLVDRVTALLVRRSLDALSLARRAGQAVCGFEKVRLWLADGTGVMALIARDAAENARTKTARLVGARPLVDLFDATDLGTAFGRDRAVHVAVAAGGLAERLITDARRLRGLLGLPDEGQTTTMPPRLVRHVNHTIA